jgi:hypothetical protein
MISQSKLFRTMHLFYIDGSQDGHFFTFSALGVRDSVGKTYTSLWRDFEINFVRAMA